MTQSVGKINLDLGLNYKQFSNNLANIAPKSKGMIVGSFGKLGLLAGAAFSARALFRFGKDAIKAGSDVAEIQNVVDVTFGAMSKQISEFASTSIDSFGLAELSAKKYASTMGAMLKSSGIGGNKLVDMSLDLTRLTADMASFYNLDNDDMFQKIQAGMSGMAMPLKRLGVDMSVANLEAYALAEGMGKTYAQMNQAEQSMLRYNYLLKITGDQQGDFSRNSHNWAHQLRILSEQWTTLKSTIGQGFINILAPIIRGFNKVIKVIQIAAEYFRAFTALVFGNTQAAKKTGSNLGYLGNAVDDIGAGAGGASDGIKGLGDSAKKAGKEAKKGLAPFDELNTLANMGGDAGDDAGGAGGGGLDDLPEIDLGDVGEVDLGLDTEMDKLKAFMDKYSEVFDFLKKQVDNTKKFFEPLGIAFENIGKRAKQSVETNAPLVRDSLARLWEQIKKSNDTVWDSILKNAQPFADNIESIFIGIIDAWDRIFPHMLRIWENFASLAITYIEQWIITVTEIFFTIVDAIATILDPLLKLVASIAETVLGSLADFLDAHVEEMRELIIRGWTVIRDGVTGIIDAIAEVMRNVFQGLLEWWEDNSQQVYDLLTKLWETLWLALSTIWGIIFDIAENIFGNLAKFLLDNSDGIRDVIVSAWELIWEVISQVWNFILDLATLIFGQLKEFWEVWGEDILSIFDTVWQLASDIFGVFLDFISGTFKVFTKIFQGDWKGAWEESKIAGEKIWNGIKDVFSTIWELLKKLAEVTWKAITDYLTKQWEATKKAGETIWKAIELIFTTVWNAIKTLGETIWKAITDFIVAQWEALKKSGETIWNAIKTVFSTVWNSIKTLAETIWKGIKDFIMGQWNGLVTGLNSVKTSIINAVKEPFNTVKSFIDGIIGDAKDWGKNMIGNFIDGIKAMAGKVADAARSVVGGVKDFLGFSSPTKKGPGSDADKWMPNMMDMMAKGITSNVGKIKSAIGLTVGELQEVGNTTLALPELANAGTKRQPQPVSKQEEHTNLADTIAEALARFVMQQKNERQDNSSDTGDIVLKIGETEFGRIAIKTINAEQRRTGKTLIIV